MSISDTLVGRVGELQFPAATPADTRGLVDLADVPVAAWARLAQQTLSPNPFYDPRWARAVAAHSRRFRNARALVAWGGRDGRRLIGLLPVVPAWRALQLPLPLLVGWQPYAPTLTPLIDPEHAGDAIHALLDSAAASGARAILIPFLPRNAASLAIRGVLAERGLAADVLRSHARARLLTQADQPSSSLGGKKLKELRRQRRRIADHGLLDFAVASDPACVAAALEDFLALEARGWKGRSGTALIQHAGDVRFIRQVAAGLSAEGKFQVATLTCAGRPVGAGLVLRAGRQAAFFKTAYDEDFAKASPGVQLALALTRHFAADPALDEVDSLADAEHPMIDRLWRERLVIDDLLIPTRSDDNFVTAIRPLLAARNAAYDGARMLVRRLRG